MPKRRRKGFTLVLTLIVLAAITLLVLGLYANVSSESATATNFDNAFRAQAAVRSGLSRVETLLQRGTWSDDYLVLEQLQNPPPATATPTDEQWRNRKPVLMLARPKVTGTTTTATGYTATWEYTPLTSGVVAPPTTNGTPSLPTTPLVARPDHDTQAADGLTQPAIGLPKRLPWQPAQDTFWEVIYEDQDTDDNPQTPTIKVPVARYCFQVEDLQGLLSLDHAGNPGDEVENTVGMLTRNHEREKFEVFANAGAVGNAPRRWYAGLAPGLRTPDDNPLTDDRKWAMNQFALYSLLLPTASTDTTNVDNRLMAARNIPRTGAPTQIASLLTGPDAWKPLMMKEDFDRDWPAWLTRKAASSAAPTNDTGRLPDEMSRRLEENTITGLQPYYELPLIPVEPGVFANPREPKMNLNRLIAQVEDGTLTRTGAVNAITGMIRRHLPEFSSRAGGYPLGTSADDRRLNYLKSLAASMIDYADTDPLPTIDPDSRLLDLNQGSYRGCDSYPVVSEQYLVNHHVGTTQENGRWKVRFSTTFYFEMWNMSNRTVSGSYQTEFSNEAKLKLGLTGDVKLGDDDALSQIEEDSPSFINDTEGLGTRWLALSDKSGNQVVSILPNEYKVLGTGTLTYKLDAGSTNIPAIDPPELAADLNSHFRLRFLPDGTSQRPILFSDSRSSSTVASVWTVIDRSRALLDRKQRSFRSATIAIGGSIPGSSNNENTGGGSLGEFRNGIGDPRSSYFYNNTLYNSAVSYATGASPGGRNYRDLLDGKFYKEVFPSKWPDRGHNSPKGNPPSSATTAPFAVPGIAYTPLIGSQAPMRISNSGRYFSVTELGNIYDPMFWDPDGPGTNVTESSGDLGWKVFWDIGAGATISAFFSGGNTLRIGRPEHQRFRSIYVSGTQPNRRLCASSLLDLFHCGQSTVGSVSQGASAPANLRDLTGSLIEIRGQINLNTASRETLRSAVAGQLIADTALATNTVFNPPTRNGTANSHADLLVDAIIKNRPYMTSAQLPERLRTTVNQPTLSVPANQPMLGDPRQHYPGWVDTGVNATKWNDAAAEEVFSRLYNSSTVRSRHFRVFVTGQALRQSRSENKQEVLSTRSRVYHVFVRSIRDAETGLINDQRVEILYEQDL